MSVLGEAALQYAERGWSVIPLQPSGKKPLISWQAYTEKRAKPEQVREWWSKWPNANIGMVTGRVSGVVAVDIDIDRGADPKSVFKDHPTELISKTGSGGWHLFYNYPEDVVSIDNRVGRDGVDVRGDGGYVVLPPSSHSSGRLYEFVKRGEPGIVPPWLLESPSLASSPSDNAQDRWLSELLEGVSQGSRNDAAARIAGYFAGKGMAREVALGILKTWNDNNDPPMPDRELERTLRSTYKTAFRRSGTTTSKTNGVSKAKDFSLMPLSAFMTKFGSTSMQWAVDGWMPEKTIAFVVSPPGSYKTWMIIDLAISVASGKPFLGKYEVRDKGPVIIIQQEDFHGQIAERLGLIYSSRMGCGNTGDIEEGSDNFDVNIVPEDPPVFIHPDRSLRFDNDEVMQALEKRIAEIRPKLVIIDPLYSAGNTDNFMAKTAEQMFVLKKMRDKYGTSFLVVHHSKKNKDDDGRERIWGSQFLNAFLETGWQIKPTGNASIVVRRHFKATADADDISLEFDIDSNAPYKFEVHETEGSFEDADFEDDISDILQVLAQGPRTIADIAKELGCHRSTASRRIKKAIDLGFLRKSGRDIVPVDLPGF